jgi:transposase
MAPSLDDAIPADHPIRHCKELLERIDWTEWEAFYDGWQGRPPIHPRLVAGCILYGLTRGIRSTRELEDATKMRLDYLWFLEGLTIDHSTFANFRNQFGDQLKALLGQLNQLARGYVGASGARISVDGTRMRANSDRQGARTATWLVEKLAELEEELDEALAQLAPPDTAGSSANGTKGEVQKQVDRLQSQKAKLETALQEARKRTEAKRAHDGKNCAEARVPVTDPDAYLIPNKEGGHGPNYNPTAAVDAETSLVVAADVPEACDEASSLPGTVEEAAEALQTPIKEVLCDGNFGSGQNLKELADAGTHVYTPVGPRCADSVVARADPADPVPEADRDQLPKRGGKLDRSAFVYRAQSDCFFCPMGRRLDRWRVVRRRTNQGEFSAVEYRCEDCSECPLRSQCLRRSAKRRTVSRDDFEPYREETAERMSTEEGRELYAKRAPLSEGVFGCVKAAMGIRQFLTRGTQRVGTEWRWICAGYSLRRLLGLAAAGAGGPVPAIPANGSVAPLAAIFAPFQLIWRLLRRFTHGAGSVLAPHQQPVTPWRALTAQHKTAA